MHPNVPMKPPKFPNNFQPQIREDEEENKEEERKEEDGGRRGGK